MEEVSKKKCSIFMESVDTNQDGTPDLYTYSMRRICAFILYIISIIFGIITIGTPIYVSIKTGTPIDFNPLAILTSFGVPAAFATLLLFFTTWADISDLAKNINK